MKRLMLAMVLSLGWSAAAFADGTRYELRVDGLVCPFCAYGIEKKLNAIDGVDEVVIDLNHGLVTVDVTEGAVTCPPRTTPATEGEFQWS